MESSGSVPHPKQSNDVRGKSVAVPLAKQMICLPPPYFTTDVFVSSLDHTSDRPLSTKGNRRVRPTTNDMEAKLRAYREEKRRQREAEKRKEWLYGMYQATSGLLKRRTQTEQKMEAMVAPEAESTGAPLLSAVKGSSRSWMDWAILVCKIGLYLTLFGISCHFHFGAAFVVVTAIPIIYFSTSTRGRRPGEASAYSVFNPGCEAIDGTLTGEQFQREIMYGPGAT